MNITKNDKLALIIRGHVRDSFDDNKLYDLIKKFTLLYDVDIYISTFNIKNGGKIYSKENGLNNMEITEKCILEYFGDTKKFIKKIIFNSNNIGNNDKMIGQISRNKFLHMWKSIYNAVKYIKNEATTNYNYVFNIRFDYFSLIHSIEPSKSTSDIKKLSGIGFFDNYITKVDINSPISLLNIDCENTLKDKNMFKSGALQYFQNRRKILKSNYMSNIKYDGNDLLYGIDNVFGGKTESMYNLTYLFVYRMNFIFDFLEKIMPDMQKITKPFGAPHEAILPLFIKNHMDYFVLNDIIIDYKNLPKLDKKYIDTNNTNIIKKREIVNILSKHKKLFYSEILENGNYDFRIFVFMKFLEYLGDKKFETYLELGCGSGILFAMINNFFNDKIVSSTCYESYYSPVVEYCSCNENCHFIEIDKSFDITNKNLNADFIFINEYSDYQKILMNDDNLKNTNIIALNRMFDSDIRLWNEFQNSNKKQIFDFVNIVDNNGVGIYVAVKKIK